MNIVQIASFHDNYLLYDKTIYFWFIIIFPWFYKEYFPKSSTSGTKRSSLIFSIWLAYFYRCWLVFQMQITNDRLGINLGIFSRYLTFHANKNKGGIVEAPFWIMYFLSCLNKFCGESYSVMTSIFWGAADFFASVSAAWSGSGILWLSVRSLF